MFKGVVLTTQDLGSVEQEFVACLQHVFTHCGAGVLAVCVLFIPIGSRLFRRYTGRCTVHKIMSRLPHTIWMLLSCPWQMGLTNSVHRVLNGLWYDDVSWDLNTLCVCNTGIYI